MRKQAVVNAQVIQEYCHHLRARLYTTMAGAEWLSHSRIRSSDFTFALTTAVERVEGAAQELLTTGATAAIAAIYLSLSLILSPLMTSVVVGSALIIVLVVRKTTKGGWRPGEDVVASTSHLYATAAEQLGGIKTAKSYGNEHRHVGMFLAAARRVSQSSLALTGTYANFRWQQTAGAAIALGVILFLSVEVFNLETGAILVLLLLFSRLVPRLVSIQQSVQRLMSDMPALASIEGLIATCNASQENTLAGGLEIQPGDVTLHDVSFSYERGRTPQTLDRVNLVVPAGKTTAIVGSSGAGKTTLADILLGLIRPDQGHVCVNSTRLDGSHLASWRKQIGYVAQDTYLFNESVRANLLWAEPGASEDEMWQALEAAAAKEFVANLPAGIDTVIGERGVHLSGGEKQRLSLARALLRKPALLILDEATSALDSENEQRIYEAIEGLRGAMTIVIITHRLATIRFADLIHVVDNGRIAAHGSWASIISGDNPRLRELALAQHVAF
jgi:ATP-binding cassette subfamily C protein